MACSRARAASVGAEVCNVGIAFVAASAYSIAPTYIAYCGHTRSGGRHQPVALNPSLYSIAGTWYIIRCMSIRSRM